MSLFRDYAFFLTIPTTKRRGGKDELYSLHAMHIKTKINSFAMAKYRYQHAKSVIIHSILNLKVAIFFLL